VEAGLPFRNEPCSAIRWFAWAAWWRLGISLPCAGPGEELELGITRRYGSLDALRGLAALGVLLFHYNFTTGGIAPFHALLGAVYQSGHYLVDLFFVLSGYLLATVYAGRRDFAGLSWRRIARLVPLHWATLVLVLVLRLLMADVGLTLPDQNGDLHHFVLNVLLLDQIGLQRGFSFNTPSWSISVEWVVNLVLFALLAMGTKRLLWPALVLVALATVLLLSLRGQLASVGLLLGFLDAALLRGVVGFFMGVALASLFPMRGEDPSKRAWDLVFLLAAVTLVFCMSSPVFRETQGLDFIYALVLMPALVVAGVRGPLVARLLAIRPLEFLGKISYSIYLVHFPMLLLLMLVTVWTGIRPSSNPILQMLIFVAATLGLSYLSWRYLEKPAQAWLNNRFAMGRDAGPRDGPSGTMPIANARSGAGEF